MTREPDAPAADLPIDAGRIRDAHDLIARGLDAAGHAVVGDFLPRATIGALREQAIAHDDAGELVPAQVGRGKARSLRGDIRGDRTRWLEDDTAIAAERRFLAAIDALRVALNRALYLGLTEFEAHYAVYPPGARYTRHRDRFDAAKDAADGRVVSCVLYLNDRWQDADGGQLRLYVDLQRTIDVRPDGGTLVCFLSDRFLHEVLPATRTRIALSGWLCRR